MTRRIYTLWVEHRAGKDEFRPQSLEVVADYRSHLAAIRAASNLQHSYRIMLGKGTFTARDEGMVDGMWVSACWRKNNSPRYMVILSVKEGVEKKDPEEDGSDEN
ncbi:hypothetical protein MMC11_004219, partial [Xylographa trunciseda]|nr:hypothetical protein [Xylographa trunciseda]